MYGFVFPHAAKDRPVKLSLGNADMMYKGSEIYKDGGEYILEEGDYTLVCDDREYSVGVYYTSDIPQVYLTT